MTIITLPYNEQSGMPEDISHVMANFVAILDVVNGQLKNDNFASDAAIALSKLLGYPNNASKFPNGNGSWSYPIRTVALADWPPSVEDDKAVFLELPADPYNPIGTKKVRWLCTYDDGDDIWHVMGPALMATVATAETRQNTAYGDLATVGPSMTVPLLGDYEITCQAHMQQQNAATMYMAPMIGATEAVDTDAAQWHVVVNGDGGPAPVSKSFTTRKSSVAATTVVKARYRNTAAQNATFSDRWLFIRPICFR